MLFFDESFILTVASGIGKPINVDLHTLRVARGRFARVCVEVDLNQPVVGKVGVNGHWSAHNMATMAISLKTIR